jgi:hypothetical protein
LQKECLLAHHRYKFKTQHNAAIHALKINATSISENREYGGLIYENSDGSYSFTGPIAGDNASVQIPKRPRLCPVCEFTTANHRDGATNDCISSSIANHLKHILMVGHLVIVVNLKPNITLQFML